MADRFIGIYGELVEWVADRSTDSALGEVELKDFSTEHGLDSDDAFNLLRYCKERGLLDDKHSTYGGPVANLTPTGRQWVETRRQRRADPMYRTATARRELLNWLWHEMRAERGPAVIDHFRETDGALVEGERLQLSEIDRAAAYLQDKGYIQGTGVAERQGPIAAEITSTGEDCVEQFGGDVTEYERHQRSGGTTVNVYGGNTGNIAANSREVTMSAKTVKGLEMTDVVIFARALRQAVPDLGLSEDDATELVETANRIEQEAASDDPDVGRLQRWRATVLALLGQTSTGALGSVLADQLGQILPALPPG